MAGKIMSDIDDGVFLKNNFKIMFDIDNVVFLNDNFLKQAYFGPWFWF